MDVTTYVFMGVGIVSFVGYILVERTRFKHRRDQSSKKSHPNTDDPCEGVEVSATDSSAIERDSAQMDDDREHSEIINPICRIKGHDFEDSEPEVHGTPLSEMAWLMGQQPTYRRYRRCKREGCTRRVTQQRTNLVTAGPWKDCN